MNNDDHRDMLDDHNKGVEEARGVLSRLFRQILADMGVNGYTWSKMMDRYLNDPQNGIASNGRERSSARGNLNKELRRPTMSWKVFRKALQFLGPTGIRFEVHLEWPTQKRTVHSLSLAVSQTGQTGIDEEDDDDKP